MKIKYKIEDFFASIKYTIKDFIKVALRSVSNNNTESFTRYKISRLNLNNYEKCKTEVIMQMQISRRLL